MIIDGIQFNVELEDVLEELRRQLSVNGIEYIQKEPKRSSDSLQIQCPYHGQGKERRRSAGIRRSDGMFHCFTCNEIHSLPEVISYCFGKDDKLGIWGWKWLKRNFITVEMEERKDVVLDFSRSGVNNNGMGRHDFVTEQELDKYRYYHKYMYERKLTNDIIELFDVGYDKETDCITFPVRDREGNCLFVARRSVHTKFFHYPAGSEKPIYGIYELEQTGYPEELIICESMIDALTCWVYGKKAVALNGLGNAYQLEQLKKLSCRKFILATDNDEAGRQARKRIKKKLLNKIITEYVLPNHRKDINELDKQEFDNLQEIF